MKNPIQRFVLILSAASAMTMLTAQNSAYHVTVPFAFEASGRSMPAGEYSVNTTDSAIHLYRMLNLNTKDSILVVGKAEIYNSSGPAKLVYQRVGDDYFLAEIWNGAAGRKVSNGAARQSFIAASKVTIPMK